MNLEEKLKDNSWIIDFDGQPERVMSVSDALSICQEAVDEAKPKRDKIEELFHKYKDCRGFNETGLIEYMSMKKFMELFNTEILSPELKEK